MRKATLKKLKEILSQITTIQKSWDIEGCAVYEDGDGADIAELRREAMELVPEEFWSLFRLMVTADMITIGNHFGDIHTLDVKTPWCGTEHSIKEILRLDTQLLIETKMEDFNCYSPKQEVTTRAALQHITSKYLEMLDHRGEYELKVSKKPKRKSVKKRA
jgi:hypothetical protein